MSSILFHDASIKYVTLRQKWRLLRCLRDFRSFSSSEKNKTTCLNRIILRNLYDRAREWCQVSASERARWPCGWDPDPIFRIPSLSPVFS
jgi:hypothetical protein